MDIILKERIKSLPIAMQAFLLPDIWGRKCMIKDSLTNCTRAAALCYTDGVII